MSKARYIIFIAGFLIVGGLFALFQLPIPEEGLGANVIFFWLSLCVLYAVFFAPLCFSSLGKGSDFDKKIPSGITLWVSILIFELVALPLSIAVLVNAISFKVALGIDLVLLFACSIFVFFGAMVSSTVKNVQENQRQMREQLTNVRSAFEVLKLKSDTLGFEHDVLKKKIASLSDEARYLSPVGNEQSLALEMQLARLVAEVSSALDFIKSGADTSPIEAKLQQLQLVLNQRKLVHL